MVAGADDYFIVPFVGATPFDVAAARIFARWNLPRPGGASGSGWSKWKTFLECPKKYELDFLTKPVEGEERAPNFKLEIGALMHQLFAFKYLRLMDAWAGIPDPAPDVEEAFRTALLDEKVSGSVVMEAYRLYAAYQSRYDNDWLRPLAVELRAEDTQSPLTCRYDLIAEVLDNPLCIPKGTWIVEHKSMGDFGYANVNGWANDGEVLGQVLIWMHAEERFAARFGELQGVIVNMIAKTKVVDFRRVAFPVNRAQLDQHARDMEYWRGQEAQCRASGYFPRKRSSCVGRYGLCERFDYCAQ